MRSRLSVCTSAVQKTKKKSFAGFGHVTRIEQHGRTAKLVNSYVEGTRKEDNENRVDACYRER